MRGERVKIDLTYTMQRCGEWVGLVAFRHGGLGGHGGAK